MDLIAPDKFKIRLFYGVSIAFILLNMVFIATENYWFMALPLAIIMLMLFFFSLDKLLLGIVFLVPLSFPYYDLELGFAIDLPTEPLIVAVMVMFFLKLFYEQKYDKALLRHPVTIVLIISLIWMLITSFTSAIPLVSFKAFLSRFWSVTAFYFVFMQVFAKKPERIQLFMWLFGASLAAVIIYITYVHSTFDFERKAGTWVVDPFFNDHTHYSAVLTFILPVFIVMSFLKSNSVVQRRSALLLTIIILMGIIFSFSRASWVSILIALAAFLILVFRVDYKFILSMLILIVSFTVLFQDKILMELERNRQESSTNILEHAQSITNISSDASNLERINRWRSAYRMFEEKPIVGWGPGTYQLVYAPFQSAEDRTIITTNFGNMGNAHSEYLGPLSESGLLGMVLFIILGLLILRTGIRNFRFANTSELRWLSMGITLGFITYLAHGLMNNFLDTVKASLLFWGFLGILVVIDIHYSKHNRVQKSAENQQIAE